MTDLTQFGFNDNNISLYCKRCGALIKKTNGATLLGTSVKYGICRKTSHGVSIVKCIQQ